MGLTKETLEIICQVLSERAKQLKNDPEQKDYREKIQLTWTKTVKELMVTK